MYMGCLPCFFVESIPEEFRSVWVCLFIVWDFQALNLVLETTAVVFGCP